MQAPGYRFEIVDRKCPCVMKSVPADKIKRMCAVYVGINEALLFDQDLKITLFIMRFQVGRPFNVTLTVWRLFSNLAISVGISFWYPYRAKAFHNEQAVNGRVKFH